MEKNVSLYVAGFRISTIFFLLFPVQKYCPASLDGKFGGGGMRKVQEITLTFILP